MCLSGLLCPDWIKTAGILEHFFSLLLHEHGGERHGLLTKHHNSDYCWRAIKDLFDLKYIIYCSFKICQIDLLKLVFEQRNIPLGIHSFCTIKI